MAISQTVDTEVPAGDEYAFDDVFSDAAAQTDVTPPDDAPAPLAPDAPATEDPAAAVSPADGAASEEGGSTDPAASGAAPDGPSADAIATPPALTPPENASYSFRADGRQIDLRGAWETPDGHIVLPKDVWSRQLQPYLADRGAWQRERQQTSQQIRELTTHRSAKEHEAEALIAEVAKVLEGGPEAFAQWADDFVRQAPLLQERAARAAAEAQLTERTTRDSAQQEQERIAALVPQLQDRLGTAVEAALQRPEFALIAETMEEKVELLRDLWERHGMQLFWEAEQDDPVRGIPKGYIGLNEDALAALLQHRVGLVQRVMARTKTTSQAAQRNGAALKPTNGKPKPAPAAPKPAPTPTEPVSDYDAFKDQEMDPKKWERDIFGT